ncbi:AAA family ATPase [Lactiplantibacillus plantarum]|uniref:AAA family ATPase n=1 Tax=Lactiplantibacillus plantarum TaxID=1590 RepID=UPI002646FC73|nr:ATP-binding protein [Lactiplantibacillus plantarum]WGS68715.1 ATP-binding protein [Lactiplantibacillus plantarum]
MLVDFNVKNYRSFKNEQEFSMETGKRLRKYQKSNTISAMGERTLKSVLLFGANANGKTNLIKALLMLKYLIVSPTRNELQPLSTDTFGYNKETTCFDITFIKHSNKYKYFLKYDRERVFQEKLLVNDVEIFERNEQHFDLMPSQLIPLKENIRKNQLLLYFAQQNNEKNSKEAFEWFSEDLMLVDTNKVRNDRFKLLEKEDFKQRFLNFLKAADFNIVDVEVREKKEELPNPEYIMKKINGTGSDDDIDDARTLQNISYDVYSTHKAEHGDFSVFFGNESTGTKVFMVLALYILNNTNKTLLIDEFDRSYHLELAEALLRLINNEKQTNQFVLTTHELSLMDTNLRQDQIWFAEKNRFGETELFSVFDFDDPGLKRSDFNYKKRYLEGQYGATQMVNTDLLLEVLDSNE